MAESDQVSAAMDPGGAPASEDQLVLAPAPEPPIEDQLRLALERERRALAEIERLKAQAKKPTVGKPTLSREARAFRERILRDYDGITGDPALEAILQTACEALDDLRRAQETLAREGETFRDRFNKPKAHPAVVTRRDARAQFLDALKRLNLDLEPLRDDAGRPPGK